MQTPLVPIIENMLPGLLVPENEPPIPEIMFVKGYTSRSPKGLLLIFHLYCVDGFNLCTGYITLMVNGAKIISGKVVHIDHCLFFLFFGRENVRETDPILLTAEQYALLSADHNCEVEISWGGGFSSNGPEKFSITHPFFMDG